MQGSRRLFAVAAVLLVLASAALAVFLLLPRIRAAEARRALLARIEGNEDAKAAYAQVLAQADLKKKDPKDPGPYITVGNNWVLIADLLRDQAARDEAIAEYERGIALFGKANTILIQNAGNAYRASGRFAEAETMYRLAIEANPGDPLGYERLIELYRVDLKKPPSEIIPVFQQALDRLLENARIIQLLAEYLVSVGRERDALQYYRLLSKRYPGQFSPVVAEIEAKLAASGTPK